MHLNKDPSIAKEEKKKGLEICFFFPSSPVREKKMAICQEEIKIGNSTRVGQGQSYYVVEGDCGLGRNIWAGIVGEVRIAPGQLVHALACILKGR